MRLESKYLCLVKYFNLFLHSPSGEIVWVLKRLYKYPKSDILKILELILFNRHIRVLNDEEAKNALLSYEKGKADFSDYFIAQLNKKYGVTYTITFDKCAAENIDFTLG